MKSVFKPIKSEIVFLGTFVFLLVLINVNFYSTTNIIEYKPWHGNEIETDIIGLKTSASSDIIHINNNWTAAKAAGICTGNGTISNPYVIEDLIIVTYPETGILVENSNVYSIIENCSIGHAGDLNAAIKLINVNNSQIINNDCSLNYYGIYLEDCNNVNISGNKASDSQTFGYTTNNGIILKNCNNNFISNNVANYTGQEGIVLYSCNNNYISGNIANDAESGEGIKLSNCKNSLITDNTVKNAGITSFNMFGSRFDDGMFLYECENSLISSNILKGNSKAGIYLLKCDYNAVLENIISDNHHGIFYESSSHNVISGNKINNNNQYGIYLTDESNNNVITDNKLSENGICIEEYDCSGNLYRKNGFCVFFGSPLFEIMIYGGIAVFVIALVGLLEIQRKKSQKF